MQLLRHWHPSLRRSCALSTSLSPVLLRARQRIISAARVCIQAHDHYTELAGGGLFVVVLFSEFFVLILVMVPAKFTFAIAKTFDLDGIT